MDKRRSVLNVVLSVFSRLILLFAGVYVRRLLIRYIGNDVNGLNSLYSSIIEMLSVAELGVGSAIVFSCTDLSWKTTVIRLRPCTVCTENGIGL